MLAAAPASAETDIEDGRRSVILGGHFTESDEPMDVSASAGRHGASDQAAPFRNRLARETSPYLLQHKSNPVDWWPWGPAAFSREPVFRTISLA